MIKNFLGSLFTIVVQWVKGLAGLPTDLVRAGLRLIASVIGTILEFIGMIVRPAMRFLAYLLLMIAAVAFVADLTPMLTGVGGFEALSVADHWRSVAPGSLQKFETAAGTMGWVTQRVTAFVLATPTWVVFAVLGGLASLAGRRPERINVFAN